MDAIIEYALDEKSPTTNTSKINVAQKGDTILIGEDANPNMLAVTFYPDNIILDIDNSSGKFDSLSSVADNSVKNYLQFKIENVTINPDLTLNLQLKNSPIKYLLVRPDGISRVNSKGDSSVIFTPSKLLNTTLPNNLFKLKSRINGLNTFPTQIFNCINEFEDSSTNTYSINNNDVLIANIGKESFVSNGEFLKKIDNSKTFASIKKDQNALQFAFENENKNITKIPDDKFNDMCNFLNINPTDPTHQTTPEQFDAASEIEQTKEHKYIKSQKASAPDVQKQPKKEDSKPKTQSKPSAPAKQSAPKEETIDLTFPMKLLGFALFFIGFLGGGLLPIILGICIGGSGYAFSAPLEKVKVGKLLPKFRSKNKKKKRSKDEQLSDQQLTNKDILNQRIETLTNTQTKYQNALKSLKTMVEQNNDLKDKITQKLSTITDQTQASELSKVLTTVDDSISKMQHSTKMYESKLKLYSTLMQNSANDLASVADVVNNDEDELYNTYETTYNKMLTEKNNLANYKKQLNNLQSKKSSANQDDQKTIDNQISQLQTKIQAQEDTTDSITKAAEKTKNLFNLTKHGKKVFAENMDGSITYNNIQNGLKILDSYKSQTEKLSQQNFGLISSNDYTKDIELQK